MQASFPTQRTEGANAEAVVIYADSRESGSMVVSILKKHCSLHEQKLEVADYLLSERVAVERKTSTDFLQSIVDKRLFEQLSNMKHSFTNPILLIEGNSLFEKSINVHDNAIRGALASITVDFSVPILWTHNQLETAKMLYRIAHREQVKKNKNTGIRGKRKLFSENQIQEFMLEGFPGISNITAKKLLKHFGSPAAVFQASESELMKADGIGRETAKRIRIILTRSYEKSILED
ncbi:MAG: hypothetical protein HY513_02505 [Candidatus Aenigmarchaeota archaeon]|nr:hypothetical protein [Candidatus Aenigmarchaeota archaeon]